MISSLSLTLFLFLLSERTLADLNGPCSQANNKIQVGTLQLESDCGFTQFCNAQGTCQDKGCRKDLFPLGYGKEQNLPPQCPKGQFCPDEEDACQTLLPVGSACQLNRDDQCDAPPNFKDLAGTITQNFNGSICLKTVCTFANVTVGQSCIVDNTAYIAYGADGSEFIDVVSRGNCMKGFYCDGQSLVCNQQKAFGQTCDADKECSSNNCESSLTCGLPPDAPKHFAVWVYAVVAIAILGGMIGTMVGLFFFHSRNRDQDREKRMQYWREQNALRQNILQMRETARSSIMSYPRDGMSSNRSSRYGLNTEDSQVPMMPKGSPSGLRNQISDEDSYNSDEGLVRGASKRKNKLTRKLSLGKGSGNMI